ncbi:plasmid maintenance protein [Borrelia crocidurae]|uniref:Borrelia ORF-A-containing protein n=1 Tax=Borrelia crocidurae (strain Achema) TaxID=1155096 RepID=I0FFF3_BORCA|nr:plasmid maintenance protein [Borrelia crocidurae]AFI32209.1 Borrelia ORF-A-containing protein [Borrelia crocidurae str. Achema]
MNLNNYGETSPLSKPSKKYHNRYYKIVSIVKFYQKNSIKYNQTSILNTLNRFLAKDELKIITLRTLRKDLALLCNKGIIKKTLLRLGEGNGSYIRYSANKYSLRNLKRFLEDKQAIVEHDANAIYKFTKETQQKYYLKNKGLNIHKSKNATKNVSHNITNNKKINNKKNKKEEKKETGKKTIDTNYMIKNVSKWKTMRYLDKIEENANKKRYEDSIIRTQEWLKNLKIENSTYKDC